MFMFKQALTCFLSILTLTSSYPDGAPLSACQDMKPGHGADPKTTPMPYSATVSATQVKPSEIINITISGNEPFRGFLIEVRIKENVDVAVGNFIIPADNLEAKTIPCFNISDSAATHTNNTDKNNVFLQWKAPVEAGVYQIYLTVVQNFKTFWAFEKGEVITVN